MPTYPTTTPSYSIVETAYSALLAPIGYLQAVNGGTIKFASLPQDLMDLTRYTPPALVVALTLEDPIGENKNLGGAVFETTMHWDGYVIASNFSVEGDGRLEGINIGPGAAVDPGTHAMIDDLVTALLGASLNNTAGFPAGMPSSKIFLGRPFAKLHWVGTDRIIYRTAWRNSWVRQQAT